MSDNSKDEIPKGPRLIVSHAEFDEFTNDVARVLAKIMERALIEPSTTAEERVRVEAFARMLLDLKGLSWWQTFLNSVHHTKGTAVPQIVDHETGALRITFNSMWREPFLAESLGKNPDFRPFALKDSAFLTKLVPYFKGQQQILGLKIGGGRVFILTSIESKWHQIYRKNKDNGRHVSLWFKMQ